MIFTYSLLVTLVIATLGSTQGANYEHLQAQFPPDSAQRVENVNEKRQTAVRLQRDARAARERGHMQQQLQHQLEASVSYAQQLVSRMHRLEMNLVGAQVTVKPGSPSHGQLIQSYPCQEALLTGRDALVALKASLYLAHSRCRRFALNEESCAKYLSTINLNTTSLGKKCSSLADARRQKCPSSQKYRSLDGSCNHRQSDIGYGTAMTGYRRLLPPDYGDAIQLPRENFKGKALPSARLISTRLSKDGSKQETDHTLALMQWSQFVEHDMSHTPSSKMSNTGGSIMCCSHDGSVLKPRHMHPSCLPVHIPNADPFYTRNHVQCLNYVRSVPAMRKDCTFGPLEQMNQASHFLDGSMIYGTSSKKALSLRQFVEGKLIDSSKGGRRFLPNVEKPSEECLVNSDATTCYRSGDVRVNGHPHLTVMYTIWHREHNRIAGKLAQINPQWSDEIVYQEARRIVVAQIEHITFNEWIPTLLGEKSSKKLQVISPKNDFPNENIDPSVTNSFSTAALRFVHSMMQSKVRFFAEDRQETVNETLLLKEHFNRPAVIAEDGRFDGLIRGLATQNSQKSDMDYIEDMTTSLYRDSYPYGLDIISLDIQRGRDHGLPGYNKFRKFCALPSATKFHHFQNVIPKSIVSKLRAIYEHPDDVDLLVGGMSETPATGSLLGPTFTCLLLEQFQRTINGDRFFYSLPNQPHSFSSEQLVSLKKVTLARILCDNGDALKSMQPNVFSRPNPSNELALCTDESRIPRLNLEEWKTTRVEST